jgi:hypothetical protein
MRDLFPNSELDEMMTLVTLNHNFFFQSVMEVTVHLPSNLLLMNKVFDQFTTL